MNRRSTAEWVTYLLEPKNWIIATTLAVGWHAAGGRGLAWGAVAAVFAGVLPTVFIDRGIRDGRWADRNVGAKRPRLIVLSFIIASVALGLVLMVGLGAPGELSGYFACMLGSIAVLAAITCAVEWSLSATRDQPVSATSRYAGISQAPNSSARIVTEPDATAQ